MRRSVAGHVECWATLGSTVERDGLTAQEAQTAIANHETAAGRTRATASEPASQADALLAQLVAEKNDGSLGQRVHEIVTKRT